MEKYFGNAYRGDPGVPHADPDRFYNIWIGSAAFSALTWSNPYMWQLSTQFKYVLVMLGFSSDSSYAHPYWHDKVMLFEQHHWKEAMKKKQPYKFKWNQYMDAELRESYYYNWPIYFK
ncbi:hypothetical protein EZV62_016298 [Acer yangbiense]|uniref:Uncharacterized protein n=1 Tax=Acer yangbiense TaxID=1000413 RepID=A0A5C7HNR3_9ROSI|nr:hypothetical protein EZV62_016298 [Acer yangbiense]